MITNYDTIEQINLELTGLQEACSVSEIQECDSGLARIFHPILDFQ